MKDLREEAPILPSSVNILVAAGQASAREAITVLLWRFIHDLENTRGKQMLPCWSLTLEGLQ